MSVVDSAVATPIEGALVRVRGQRWIVGAVEPGVTTLVELNSIEDGRYGELLSVAWEVEVDAEVIDSGALPGPGDFDPPPTVAAFLDAARWSSATSADVHHLQAPFRSGVVIEDYQLEPLARALTAPRVNLLLADDVGLGKTIEAGLVALELLLRHRARNVLIVCPAGLTTKWRDEMAEKFGLDFTVVDAEECARLRRVRGASANPFRSHPLVIVSLPWLRTSRAQRLLDELLPAEVDPAAADLRPADPGRGSPRGSRGAQTALRGRLPADQAAAPAHPALRAPALLVRHPAQRLFRVLPGAA